MEIGAVEEKSEAPLPAFLLSPHSGAEPSEPVFRVRLVVHTARPQHSSKEFVSFSFLFFFKSFLWGQVPSYTLTRIISFNL